jgi:outer membrane receptor for ferrienterochelin and colicin
VKDLSIRESRSSNNNTKDSYEIAPGYTWDVAEGLMLTQSYRLYIQYTDYIYSDLESVSRKDDYNKRGILNTRINWDVTDRLELTLKHDYNKRFNATKTGTDASGTSSYFKDQIQSINKIDLGLKFEAARGVILEAASYRSKDVKDTYGVTTRRTTTFSGEVWVGAKVRKKWGRENPLELSAAIRKYNAYGPSVTATSADYWDADVWLKWSF